MSRSLRYGLDLALLACLALAGLRLSSGLEAVVDLTLFDETGYLYAGTHLRSAGLLPPAWAPLYGVWYFGLAQLQPEPVALYYLNYRVLATGAPLLVYLLLRAYALPRLLALSCAWCFLLAAANLPVWPKPGSLALCLSMLFLIVARDLRSPTRSTLILTLGALLCSYVRPEYALAGALLFGLYLALLWRGRARLVARVELAQLAVFLVAAFGLAATFGLAALDRNNDRGFEAFAQHYALNWATWRQSSLDPWTEYERAIAESFGAVDSLGAAALANPGALARHVASNLLGYPPALAAAFLVHFTPLLPPAAPWSRTAGAWALGLLALAAVAWGCVRRRGELRRRLSEHGLRLAIFGLLCAPAALSAVLIYPRPHYLLLHGVVAALALGLLLAEAPRPGRGAAIVCVAAGLSVVALTPPVAKTWLAAGDAGHPNRDTVEFIRGLAISAPTNLLEAEGGFHVYLGDQFERVPPDAKTGGFMTFLRERRIGMVVVSEKLERAFGGDPEWRALMADPAAAGFRRMVIPGTGRQLLLADDP